MDEHVTVISGTFMLGFGDRIDVGAIGALTAGSYVMFRSVRRVTTS